MDYDEIKADVLIAGGAIAGIEAAIHAKIFKPELEVVVIDKAKAAKSGCAYWGGGDITYVIPEDDMEKWVAHYMLIAGGVAEKSSKEQIDLGTFLEEARLRVEEMVEWGTPFERDDKGALLRKFGRGGGAPSAVCRGSTILEVMRRKAKEVGVRFVDHLTATDFLLNRDGEAAGAIGFVTGVDDYRPVLLPAPAIVLATGPCSFKAVYMGHRMCTGDGMAAAYRHGATFMGMEFAKNTNSGPRHYDISGMARFVSMGGKFVNKRGEAFMVRYDPVLGNMANFSTLIYAMATEFREGRGPIYFDMTDIGPDDFELSRRILPHTFNALDRMGLDFRRDRLEWIPSFAGNRATGAGLKTDSQMETTIPGLFAVGDSTGKYWYGASAGYHGMNFAWCAVSGQRAGRAAAALAEVRRKSEFGGDDIKGYLARQVAPLRAKKGIIEPNEAIAVIQDALIPYERLIITSKDSLTRALTNIENLSKDLDNIHAQDIHFLVKAHEAKNMALMAEMILRASLERTESRGVHHREDYPDRDDANWRKWLYLRKAGSEMRLWSEA